MIKVTIEDTETKEKKYVQYDTIRLLSTGTAYIFFVSQVRSMVNMFLHELKYGKKGGKKP